MHKEKKNFLLVASSQFVSDLGNWFYTIAISATVYALTKSALALSMVLVTSLIPAAIFSIVGGGISDKYNAKKLMIFTDLFRSISVLLTLFVNSADTVYIVFLVSMINSICGATFTTSRYVILQKLLSKDSLNKSFSKLRILYEITVILGSALGGIVLGFLGFKYVIYFDSLTFILSLLLILGVNYKGSVIEKKVEDKISFIKMQKEGLKYIFTNKSLTDLVIFKVFYTISGGIINILPTILAMKIFDAGNNGLGFAYAFIGVGSIIGAFLVGKVDNTKFRKSYLLYSGILISIAWLFLLLKVNFYVSLALISVVCIGDIFSYTYIESFSISGIKSELVGRVSGVFQFVTYFSLAISLTVIAKLLDYNFNIAIIVCIVLLVIPNILVNAKGLLKTRYRKESQEIC